MSKQIIEGSKILNRFLNIAPNKIRNRSNRNEAYATCQAHLFFNRYRMGANNPPTRLPIHKIKPGTG